MSFTQYLSSGFGMMRFDAGAVQNILTDEERTNHTLVVVSIVSLILGGIFSVIFAMIPAILPIDITDNEIARGNFFLVGFVVGALIYPIATFIGAGIYHLLAKIMGGVSLFKDFYSVYISMHLAFLLAGILVGLLTLIPLLGPLISFAWGIYVLIVFGFVIRESHKLTTGKAVAVILIPIIIMIVIMAALFFFLGPLYLQNSMLN